MQVSIKWLNDYIKFNETAEVFLSGMNFNSIICIMAADCDIMAIPVLYVGWFSPAH